MSQLIESIRLADGKFYNLELHQARMDTAYRDIFRIPNPSKLASELAKQNFPKSGIYKCRVIYEAQIQRIEFVKYEQRPVNSLMIIHDNTIVYNHKFYDRQNINTLYDQRNRCDDILIVKNNLVTDSSYSNVLFFDGVNWVTPDKPLLRGIMRESLLRKGIIFSREIKIDQISSFKKVKLVNAMLGFDGPEIDVSGIVL